MANTTIINASSFGFIIFLLMFFVGFTNCVKLQKPTVIMISCDGFRFGFQYKTKLPNIARLIATGTEAKLGLIPVYPTLTFPNHYSIATGLYPAYHGIVNNKFIDPSTGETFLKSSKDPKWWLGEPLWATVANHGLKAAAYFWPGAEAHNGKWVCPEKYCYSYNESVPFEERVDTVLNYFDLPAHEIPVLVNLYFEDPDAQGHKVGPDDPQITEAVSRLDSLIGKLIKGLKKRHVFEDVHIILLGDHGMVGTCDGKVIALNELAPWIKIPTTWIERYSPILAIRPSDGYKPSDVVKRINQGLRSGKVENGKNLRVYLKEDLPSRLHYGPSERIAPIIGLVDEGYLVDQNRSKLVEFGDHGYDNGLFSMRTIFIGHGPRFARGRKVPSFVNVEIYNLVTSLLNIKGAQTNGSASFPASVLLPI